MHVSPSRLLAALLVALALAGCSRQAAPPLRTRAEALPPGAVKQQPSADPHPPLLHASEWAAPIPLPGAVNTAGAEDSPYVSPDGNTLYFFFTPDVRVPVEKQLLDGVTGIYRAQKVGGRWGEAERVLLSDDVALDGCVALAGDVMWFASARAGNLGEVDVYTARLVDGRWAGVQNAGRQLNVDYDVGELHVTADGQTMYCGGPEKWDDFTGKDLFVLHRQGDGWSAPEPLPPPINTEKYNEDQPFVTPDGSELWFTGQSRLGQIGPAVYRSRRTAAGAWGAPEEVVSCLAGEPTLDAAGNLYFIHHYYTADMAQMLEADVYVAYRR